MKNLKIPSVIPCSFDLGSKFLFYGCFIFFSLFAVGLPLLIDEKMTLGLVFAVIIFALISILCFYIIIMVDFLKKYYIVLSEEGISIKTSFRKEKTFKWKEIEKVGVVSINSNVSIGFILKKDILIKDRSIGKNLNSIIGVPNFSYQFPIRFFGELDPEIFIKIITQKIESGNHSLDENEFSEVQVKEEKLYKHSLIKGLFYSFIAFIISMLIHAFFVIVFLMNIIILPIIGSIIIVSVFDKYYPKRNILTRVIKGFISSAQIPMSIVFSIMWAGDVPFNPFNFFIFAHEYISYLFFDILSNWIIILIVIICFFMGVLINTNKNN